MIRYANNSYWQNDQIIAEVDERGREREGERERESERRVGG